MIRVLSPAEYAALDEVDRLLEYRALKDLVAAYATIELDLRRGRR